MRYRSGPGVLQAWMWWVRDEKARQKLLEQGCTVTIYTLGELALVADSGPKSLRDIHAIKMTFGTTIEPPEAP